MTESAAGAAGGDGMSVRSRKLTPKERQSEATRARFSQAVQKRVEEIAATIGVLVKERAVLEEHRRLVLLGVETPEIALAAIRARGIDVSPVIMRMPDRSPDRVAS